MSNLPKKPYSRGAVILDLILFFLTGGLWGFVILYKVLTRL